MSENSIVSVTQARQTLFGLIDQVNDSHEPVTIVGKRANAILVSEDDWHSIQETLYLKSIPGVWESIVEGMKEPLAQSADSLPW
jgi:antitoxin YefM